MSSSIESYSPSKPTRKTTSIQSMRGRLLWKDAREIVPIWVTLLLAAVLCLSVTLWMVSNKSAHISPLYISGHTFIALISVITGVFLLASESENRTVHLLRNLPLPPKQIIWQKLLLGGVGVIVFACFIALITMLLARFADCSPLQSGSTYRFTFANIFLLPLFYLVVALFSSMITRSHFYGVLIAGALCAGAIALLEPTWFGARGSNLNTNDELRWLWVTLITVAGICALVFNANVWVEEKTNSKPKAESFRSTKPLTGISTVATSPNPLPVLLWQSFRQARTPLLCCFGLVILGWILIPIGFDYQYQHVRIVADDLAIPADDLAIPKTFVTLLWMLGVMVAFASTVFLDDKRNGNFLFFQQNRERARWFWLARLLPFFAIALLLTLAWNFFVLDLGPYFQIMQPQNFNAFTREMELVYSMVSQAASQSFLVPLVLLLGIIGIGQYFSMFVRNPILSFIFTGLVSLVFAGIASYVIFVNESVWLFLIPMVAAGYLATWWRSKPWLASSSRAGKYFMPVVLPVIVLAIVAQSFINTRATEFGDFRFDPSNFADFNSGALLDVDSERPHKSSLQRVEFGTEAKRQQAASLYREAINLAKDEFARSLTNATSPKKWSAEKTADVVSKHQVAIDKIVEASLLPACAPFLSDDSDMRAGEKLLLETLALVNSHHQLLNSNLPAAKRSIDAHDRVWQRTDLGIGTNTRYQSGHYGLLIAWAEHPDQKLDAIKNAIALLEGSDSDIRPTKIVNSRRSAVESDSATGLNVSRFYREFGGERAFMNLQREIASLQNDDRNHGIAELKHNYRLMPWEYQRQLKVCQLRAFRMFDQKRTMITSYSMRNDRSLNYRKMESSVAAKHYWPRIPIDEDRVGFGVRWHYSLGYRTIQGLLEEAHWRRYTLLRMGLAAYKIEHKQYPDDLVQLKDYYQHELPTTTDGQMFGWFKDGLGADLIEAVYEDADSNELKSAEKIAVGGVPLLLPFPIVSGRPLPTPIDYDEGKLGIDISPWLRTSPIFMPNYNSFSYYKFDWNVGVESESSD